MTPRVMIVEDEEPLSLMLRYNLEAEGYQVDTVERGDDAETRLRENVPDLLLLDWMLPGVSGIELCRRLRSREQTRSLPIIMLTARGEEQERVRGLATGADDYVVKPFSVPELMARVRAILRRSRPELIASVLRAGEIELDRETHRVRRVNATDSRAVSVAGKLHFSGDNGPATKTLLVPVSFDGECDIYHRAPTGVKANSKEICFA